MNELGTLQDLIIQIHDLARGTTDQTIARKLRSVADKLAEIANELKDISYVT